ncbi:hypothetical protein BC827DRAFT_208291 [Russula dissimulans]|nr:hypothetical protein BC827DRAFT_208291 [Russula dissimulans]
MSALPPVHPYPGIARVAGPRLLGGLWNWCLYGVLGVQCYVYSYYFPEDNRTLKTLVYAVLFLETVQTALSGADLYYWFVSGYGDLTHLSSPYASPFDVPLIESVVSLIVEFFFAYRIWVLGAKRSGWFCLPICLCSMLNAGAAFAGGIYQVSQWRNTQRLCDNMDGWEHGCRYPHRFCDGLLPGKTTASDSWIFQ